MNNRWKSAMSVAMAGALCLAGGCAPPGENLVMAGKAVAQTQSTGEVQISRADVYQDDGTLVVDISLQRPTHDGTGKAGHIDVAVLGPDGSLLKQDSFGNVWRRCGTSTFIWARLPIVAPKGSTVRVLFHADDAGVASRHTPADWEVFWKAAPRT